MKNVFFTLAMLLFFGTAFATSKIAPFGEAPHTFCVYHEAGVDCLTVEDPSCEGDSCFTAIWIR